jgi:hypothetical protein
VGPFNGDGKPNGRCLKFGLQGHLQTARSDWKVTAITSPDTIEIPG